MRLLPTSANSRACLPEGRVGSVRVTTSVLIAMPLKFSPRKPVPPVVGLDGDDDVVDCARAAVGD
jgi:hypothetical protein